jgi:hypothetical protein
MVALAVVQSGLSSRPYAPAKTGAYLIQGLDPDQIARITIGSTISPSKGTGSEPLDSARGGEHAEPQVILARRGANFVVASKDNYPALVREINKLITTCLDIQTAELYTDNPANHKDLGVTEEDARIVVRFYKADSSGSTPSTGSTSSPQASSGQASSPQGLLTGVVIGKPKEKGPGGYVRRVEDNKVYVTAAQIPWIKKRATDYIEQELTNVKREDINSVTVSCPNETYVLRPARLGEGASLATEGMEVPSRSRAGDDNTVVLENLPEGKKLKNDVANSVFTALANLRFDDVNAESARVDLQFARRYICRLEDSTAYTLWLAKAPASPSARAEAGGDRWFVRCDAQFADKTPVTKTQGEVESQDELEKKEAKLLARDAAEEFAEKHKGWVYQIPDYQAENLTKPLAELVEELVKAEKEGQPAEETATVEVGEPLDGNDEPADE